MTIHFNLKSGFIAELLNGNLVGSQLIDITGINRIEHAANGDISFIASDKYYKYLENSHASCLLIPKDFKVEPKENQCLIYVDNPYLRFIQFLRYLFDSQPKISGFKHPASIIDGTAIVSDSAYIGPFCVIGPNCIINDDVVLKSNITLYNDVKIGNGSFIHAGVVCCSGTVIGENCLIHPGAVIGSDGFGFTENKDGSYDKIPQLGNVVIGNNVEIGANVTIDRSVAGSTIIGDGVKLDNLIHIAHNVEIGENTAMAAQTGISGSTKIGKRNRFGGQVGVAGHIYTTDDVLLMAQSGVAKSIPEPGSYFGSPIKERIKAFRIEAALNHLPEFINDIRKFQNEINQKINKPS